MRDKRYLSIVVISTVFLISCTENQKEQPGDKTDNNPKTITQTTNNTTVANKPTNQVYDRYYNDLARYLGGLTPDSGSVLAAIEKTPEALAHRKFWETAWPITTQKSLAPLKKFSEKHLGQWHTSDRTAFYPFSGPDFIFMNTIYPNAKKYVFFGREPEGILPTQQELLENKRLAISLNRMKQALNDILAISFFITKDMKAELQGIDLAGTTPILLAFMARQGYEVLNVRRIHINKAAAVEPLDRKYKMDEFDDVINGVEITFRKHNTDTEQVLEYYSVNIKDVNFKNRTEFQQYIKSLKPTSTYLKAASYIPHDKTFFSIARSLILEVSDFLLQDDSGFPLDDFPPDKYDLKFFGTYVRPIPVFRNYFQPALLKIYKDNAATIPVLDFGIGYNKNKGGSNLMSAKRK
jgi:hypothetical protein